MTLDWAKTRFFFNNVEYYNSETLTAVCYPRNLIAVEMLSHLQLQWLNAYHKPMRESLQPILNDKLVLGLLREQTENFLN
jgi:hypothetical protein